MIKNLLILVLVLAVIGAATYAAKDRLFRKDASSVEQTNATGGSASSGSSLSLAGKGLTKTPAYVFDMSALVELNLSNNKLDGALQSQVGQLKHLRVLNVSNNLFTGVPAEIGQLSDLEVLNLSNNRLTGLPNELGNLSKLRLLDVSGNQYSAADLAGIRAKLPATTVIKTQ